MAKSLVGGAHQTGPSCPAGRRGWAGRGSLLWITAVAMTFAGCGGVLPGQSSPSPAATAALGSAGCRDLVVEPGTGRIAWTVTTQGTASSGYLAPVGMGDGFLVGSFECVGFVEASGRLRWTMSGGLSAAARVGDTVVIARRGGTPNIVGLQASTGRRLWGKSLRGFVDTIVPGDGAILVTGSGVTALSVTDGSRIGEGLHAHGRFSSALAARDLLVTAGIGDGQEGAVVAADRSGHVVLDEKVAMISPAVVAVTDETIVVQSDGVLATRLGSKSRQEPPTHVAGVDRTSGKTRWYRQLDGPGASRGVGIGSTVVIQLDGALTGIDADSGDTRWSRPKMMPGGFGVDVDDQAVVVGDSDGSVEAVESDTGEVRWSTKLDGPVERLGQLGDDMLLAASATGSIAAFRAADGTTLWSARGATLTTASAGGLALRSVVAASGTVVMPGGPSSLIALRTTM